jgi:hypothetical protein
MHGILKHPETRIGCDRKGCKLPFTPKNRQNKYHPACNVIVNKIMTQKSCRATHKSKKYRVSAILSPLGIQRIYSDMK